MRKSVPQNNSAAESAGYRSAHAETRGFDLHFRLIPSYLECSTTARWGMDVGVGERRRTRWSCARCCGSRIAAYVKSRGVPKTFVCRSFSFTIALPRQTGCSFAYLVPVACWTSSLLRPISRTVRCPEARAPIREKAVDGSAHKQRTYDFHRSRRRIYFLEIRPVQMQNGAGALFWGCGIPGGAIFHTTPRSALPEHASLTPRVKAGSPAIRASTSITPPPTRVGSIRWSRSTRNCPNTRRWVSFSCSELGT